MEAARPLDEIVANRRWSRRLDPFPHVVATDLFVPAVADELDAAVRAIVAAGQLVGMGSYDATASALRADTDWPLRLFLTPAWMRLLAGACRTTVAPFVGGSVHHHEVGSRTGEVHSDLSPIFFPEGAERDGMTVVANDVVNHKTGVPARPDVKAVRTVRAVAILYYTANEPWTPGDGGETGLYRRRTDPPDRPAARVAPHNNSMVAFECTPNSFHSFVTNRAKPRRSVTMWLHRRDTDVVDRWGEESIVAWPGAGVVPVPTAGVATTGAATP